MPRDRRGARAEEHIALLRTLWCATEPYVEFAPMDPRPQPVQRPIPILVGGHSDRAIDRAVRIGDGWIAALMSVNRLAELITTLRRAAESHGREPDSIHTVASSTYTDSRSFADSYRALRRLSIDHLQVVIPEPDPRLVIVRLAEIAAAATRVRADYVGPTQAVHM
ncbi:LLM class flavin-dependent oxidoreductase [Mycobacterium sp. CPCC 205710]|uniref:LLM class flavin-dependent oxidoreductase n=1 Tax=Mycobacterium deserti TaxID=2978347 RepID=A0ABT2MFZ7_9MYCO|nr:LLM class flavin-dependent oxidoreductase [Mycobacterium deserti]MCT7661214.1 LLM class flavin-dependent oxidoreductase [Mycobacterium deserti]